jgi:hypothetical protein
MRKPRPKAPRFQFGLVFLVVSSGFWTDAGTSNASVPVPSLSVQPTSGPVGSVVTVRDSSQCGPHVLFGPAGTIQTGSSLGFSSVIRYVIPSFVGDPAEPVTKGHFEFAVTCRTPGTSSGISNVVVPFLVTGGASPDQFVGMASTPDGGGYWLVQANGGVYSFGNAVFHGLLPAMGVRPSDPIVGMAATGDDGGYWLTGADGGLFSFGDAPYCQPLGIPESTPIYPEGTLLGPDLTVGIATSVGYATVDDVGYGFVEPLAGQPCAPGPGLDVGGQIPLPTFVVGLISGIAVSHTGGNVWMVGNDGGVFAAQIDPEGSSPHLLPAPFYGSLPSLGITPDAPIVGISATPDGRGYWLVGADGGVFSFGDAVFHGSAA